MRDKRALKILTDTYWSPEGWKCAGHLDWSPSTPPEDLAYAVEAGVMFPPRVMRHDQTLKRLFFLRSQLDPGRVGRAFAASLSNKRVEWRSALGTFAVARHLPDHSFRSKWLWRTTQKCSLCGALDDRRPQDMNILSFERFRWGGARHDDPVYMVFDLERFLAEEHPEPTVEDRALLAGVLDAAAGLPPPGKLAGLVDAVTPIVPGNRDQRRAVVSMLGYAGILAPVGYPSHFLSFVPFSGRAETPWYKDDWPYPVCWWRGEAGLNLEAVELWFGWL